MKWYKYLFLLVLLSTGIVTNAQNKKYDWSIGASGGIYSYSAILERKLTNPYEYRIGANVTVSRYLNNHFDLTLQGNRSPINYPIAILNGEPVKYERTHLYGANFTLKYKLDNGYIMKEHTMFAPYIMLGAGASMTTLVPEVTYAVPVGLGVRVHLGERTSLIFESQYNHDFLGSLSYMQYNAGLKVNFGKANKKRLQATRRRERERRYAKIRKYREEQRLVQAQKAKERLDKMKAEGLVGNMMTMEEDADLLDTETIVLNNEDAPVVTNVNAAPSKPKEATITRETNPKPKVTQPVVPSSSPISESPGKPSFEEENPKLEEKPSIPKPKLSREEATPESTIVQEEESITAPTKPKEEIVETVVNKPKPVPSKPKEEVAEVTKPIPPTPQPPVEKPKVEEKPPIAKIEEETETKPIKEQNNFCKNSEVELTAIGEKINFDSDRYRIRSRMHDELDEIITILKECEDNSYVIIAHTDSDGDDEYNKKLARRRAIVIKKYLMDRGIDGSRLIVVAYGSSVPVAPNTSGTNKAKNRRIEFRLNRTSFDE